MHDGDTLRLPAGYHLDLISDPDTIILRRPSGAVVARFSRIADPKEIKLTAEEDALRARRALDGRASKAKG